MIPRPRSSSLMVPFMGGVIVPSNEIDNQVKQRLKMRRNTLPANHITTESEQAELQRLTKAPAMAPVLQNPNYLQVDPFPLLNVPQHQTNKTSSTNNKDQNSRRSPTPNKTICFEEPPTTLIVPPKSPCPSDEGCENGE